MAEAAGGRPAREVLEDHLFQRKYGTLEDDLTRNYHEDVVLVVDGDELQGHDGVRVAEGRLSKVMTPGRFRCRQKLLAGELAFVAWEGEGSDTFVDGADAFLIRDGRICVQTVWMRVRDRGAR